MKQKISVGSPEDRGFEQKTFNLTLRDIFRVFYSWLNNLLKCLDKHLLRRNSSLIVSHGPLTKGRPLEARHETKDFNRKPGTPWI